MEQEQNKIQEDNKKLNALLTRLEAELDEELANSDIGEEKVVEEKVEEEKVVEKIQKPTVQRKRNVKKAKPIDIPPPNVDRPPSPPQLTRSVSMAPDVSNEILNTLSMINDKLLTSNPQPVPQAVQKEVKETVVKKEVERKETIDEMFNRLCS